MRVYMDYPREVHILVFIFSFIYLYWSLWCLLDLAGEEKRLRVRGPAGEQGLHHLHWRHREPPPPLVSPRVTPLPCWLVAMMCALLRMID